MASAKRTLAFLILFLTAGTFVQAQQQTVGLFQHTSQAYDGYTLMSPARYTTSYLLNNDGRPVHTWTSAYQPGLLAYLQQDGHLLRGAVLPSSQIDPHFVSGAGYAGRMEEFDWDGTLVWEFNYSSFQHLSHHDFKRLPNGNVVMIAWGYKTAAEAIAAGRNPSLLVEQGLWPEHIIEVQPTPPIGGTIVWEWNIWDHLIQDFDPTKANYGIVGNHPELIDLNPDNDTGAADWLHFNGIDYNQDLDQLVVSVHRYSEFWVIDHSTTTAQASGHTGGRSGKGGDLLYRWGNPRRYDAGTTADQKLYRQHDAQWIKNDLPGAGHFLVFNNGQGRPEGAYSTIEEIIPPPVDSNGNYQLSPGPAYGPPSAVWTYIASPPTSFFSSLISGAQRQPNGNTLICTGLSGVLFEVTSASQTVWKYINPVNDTGPISQGVSPTNNLVFKVRRYAPDYPGLIGRTLTPGQPLEGFLPPQPVPDGAGSTTPMTASRLSVEGDQIRVDWDATSCPAVGTKLLFGNLATVSSYALSGSQCSLGTSGTFTWNGVPAGNLFFILVGRDPSSIYESSWGRDGDGSERNGTTSSFTCGSTTKSESQTCL